VEVADSVKRTSLLHCKTVYNTGPRGVKIKSQFCRLNVADRSFCQCDTSPSDKTQTLVSGWELELSHWVSDDLSLLYGRELRLGDLKVRLRPGV
jgi:hypothetical protein